MLEAQGHRNRQYFSFFFFFYFQKKCKYWYFLFSVYIKYLNIEKIQIKHRVANSTIVILWKDVFLFRKCGLQA